VDDAELIEAAARARDLSHVPYSGFAMGAAVLTDTGEVRVGAVVENVSLGLAMCAERVALFSTVATEAGRPVALALVSPCTSGSLTHPCGACLQVSLELGGPDLRVLVADPDGGRSESTLGQLLPKGPSKRPHPKAS
jgi:cytidine deaminase